MLGGKFAEKHCHPRQTQKVQAAARYTTPTSCEIQAAQARPPPSTSQAELLCEEPPDKPASLDSVLSQTGCRMAAGSGNLARPGASARVYGSKCALAPSELSSVSAGTSSRLTLICSVLLPVAEDSTDAERPSPLTRCLRAGHSAAFAQDVTHFASRQAWELQLRELLQLAGRQAWELQLRELLPLAGRQAWEFS